MNKNNINITLVDDHVLLRNGLASLINTFEGYSVLSQADNGKEFIKQLVDFPNPDIVLLDITMPEMNGFETADWIRQHLPNVKVLVLSVMDADAIIINMLKKGARGYLLKDSKPAVFKQALDSLRDTGFYLNELVSNKMLNYVTQTEKSQKKDTSAIGQLTEKEITFLQMVCTEMTYKEIAEAMKLSPRTIDGYRDDLLKKLNVQSRIGLVTFAIKHGIYKL